jgi:hypothetical protein
MLLLLLKRVSLSKPVACGLARNRGQFALETNSACESGAGAGDLAAYEQIRFSVQGRKITIPYLEWSVVISRDNKQPSEGSVVLSNKQNFLCTGIRFCYLFFFFCGVTYSHGSYNMTKTHQRGRHAGVSPSEASYSKTFRKPLVFGDFHKTGASPLPPSGVVVRRKSRAFCC